MSDIGEQITTNSNAPNDQSLTADMVLKLYGELSEKAAKIPTGARLHPTDYYKLKNLLLEAGAETVTVMGIPFGFQVFEDENMIRGKAALVNGRGEIIGIMDLA